MLSTEREIFRRCQASLRSLKEQGKFPNRENVPEIVNLHYKTMKEDPAYPSEHFKFLIIDDIIEKLQSGITTTIGNLKILDAKNTSHLEWLQNKDQSNWIFSQRHKEYLGEKLGDVFSNKIYDAADAILSRLEDPTRGGPWRRQGLVFGNVQSGKTTSYAALVNKAVDAGYKIIIVLGGLNNNLRAQTQEELEKQFVGRTSAEDDTKSDIIEVGEINSGEKLQVNMATSRDVKKGDFNKNKFNAIKDINLNDDPILFVIKKNTSSLANVISYFQSRIQEGDEQMHQPLLLIDDECDHGSVNTNDPDGTTNPTRLNSQIRGLMAHFSRCAYVAYTATPFANIFINPDNAKLKFSVQGDYVRDEQGNIVWDLIGKSKRKRREKIIKEAEDNDLFPRDFVINLPISPSYIGAKKIFNIPDFVDEEFISSPLPIVNTIEQLLDYDQEKIQLEKDWIPRPHKKTTTFEYNGDAKDISPTLKYAIKCFILSIAIRNLRVGSNKHNTMLINVTNFNDTQGQIINNVREELQYLIEGLKGNYLSLLNEFQEIWRNDYQKKTNALNEMIKSNELDINEPDGFNEITWAQVSDELVKKVANKKIEVHGVYGDNRDVLGYEKQYQNVGLNVIAVGAIKLSRGLVLKDLTVSYFKRPSKQYDTLLQMGRWFGYRPRYLDACRLFLESELLDWFEKASIATEKLKEKFQDMIDAGKSPEDWGLAVRTFPDVKNLIPTARNKMKSSAEYNLGGLAQTRPTTTAFDLNKSTTDNNLSILGELLSNEKSKINKINNNTVFQNVKSGKILDFLKKYRSSKFERNFIQGLLTEFIEESNKKGLLNNWDIFVKGKQGLDPSKGFVRLKKNELPIITRSPFTAKSALKVLVEGKHYKKIVDGTKTRTEFLFENILKENSKSIKETYHVGNVSDPVDLPSLISSEDLRKSRIDYEDKMKKENEEPKKIIPESIIRKNMNREKGYICFYLFNPSKHEQIQLNKLYDKFDTALVGFAVHLPDISINKNARINKKMQEQLGLLDYEEDYYSEEEDD